MGQKILSPSPKWIALHTPWSARTLLWKLRLDYSLEESFNLMGMGTAIDLFIIMVSVTQ